MHPICYESTLNHHDTLSKVDYSNAWKETGYGHLVVVIVLWDEELHPWMHCTPFIKHTLRWYFLSLAAEEEWFRLDFFIARWDGSWLWRWVWSGNSSHSDAMTSTTSDAIELQADIGLKCRRAMCTTVHQQYAWSTSLVRWNVDSNQSGVALALRIGLVKKRMLLC